MNFPHLQESFDRAASKVNPLIGGILDRALSGADISVDEATQLFEAEGPDLPALILAANHLRTETVGDIVTYVVNRNINFTNVCVKACGFCAFSRGHLAEEGYFLPVEEIIRRGQEAREQERELSRPNSLLQRRTAGGADRSEPAFRYRFFGGDAHRGHPIEELVSRSERAFGSYVTRELGHREMFGDDARANRNLHLRHNNVVEILSVGLRSREILADRNSSDQTKNYGCQQRNDESFVPHNDLSPFEKLRSKHNRRNHTSNHDRDTVRDRMTAVRWHREARHFPSR